MKITVFRSEITPPIGHPLCAGWYPAAEKITDRLFANGVVLFPEDQQPIVLCALDWAELSNDEYDLWKEQLARAADTGAERVAVHCIHAHDSPWPDRSAQRILDAHGFPDVIMHREWCAKVLVDTARSVEESLENAQTVTSVRTGKAPVYQVASNRRVFDDEGQIHVRWTQCRDEKVRAAPEGSIDPFLKTISFWQGEEKLVALHYYAVHPTSYDGTGAVTTDFVGIARERLSKQENVPHIYFTECAGDITCGKYNDGTTDNRELFTQRILEAMLRSEEDVVEHSPEKVRWKTYPVVLPPREDLTENHLLEVITKPDGNTKPKSRAAIALAYRRRCEAKIPILISALHLGDDIISVHLPGEAFMEYQKYAQQLAPRATVVVPSYGDCGPGYIPLARSYEEGGYEPTDAFCGPGSETLLREAIRSVMSF